MKILFKNYFTYF